MTRESKLGNSPLKYDMNGRKGVKSSRAGHMRSKTNLKGSNSWKKLKSKPVYEIDITKSDWGLITAPDEFSQTSYLPGRTIQTAQGYYKGKKYDLWGLYSKNQSQAYVEKLSLRKLKQEVPLTSRDWSWDYLVDNNSREEKWHDNLKAQTMPEHQDLNSVSPPHNGQRIKKTGSFTQLSPPTWG